MPVESLHLAARGDVPEAYCLVVTAGDQAFAVGGEGEAFDRAGVPAGAPYFLAANIIKTDGESAGRGDVLACRREGNAADFLGGLGKTAHDLARFRVPVQKHAVLVAGGEVPAVGGVPARADGVGMPDHWANFLEFDARQRRIGAAVPGQKRPGLGPRTRALVNIGGSVFP